MAATEMLGIRLNRGTVLPEWLSLHVDLETRRVAPWPDEIPGKIAKSAAAQGEQPWPEEAGRTTHVQEPLYTMRTTHP